MGWSSLERREVAVSASQGKPEGRKADIHGDSYRLGRTEQSGVGLWRPGGMEDRKRKEKREMVGRGNGIYN